MDVFAGVEENHQMPAMVPDGYGGMLFVYQKYSSESHGTDIYRGRLSPGGEVSFHFATCFSADEQLNPKIVKKGSKALLCWEDRRNGNWDLYAQMIRLKDGLLEWGVNGVPVVKTIHDERNPVVISSSSYGYQVFSWLRKEGNNYRIAVQKLDNLGEPAGMLKAELYVVKAMTKLIPVSLQMKMEVYGALGLTGDKRVPLTFSPSTSTEVALPLLKASGLRLAADHSQPFASVTGLKILASRQGDFYLTWEDYRNGSKNPDIYIQKISPEGKFLWRTGGIPICIAPGEQNRPIMVEDGVGGIILAWADRRNGVDDNIYAQRINAWGKVLWQDDGVLVCDAPSDQNSLRGVPDGKEGIVLCWVDARSLTESGFDLYIQRIGHEGTALWTPNGKPFAKFPGLQTSPSLAEDGHGGAYVTWMDSRGAFSNIYVQHLDEFGMYEWEYGGRLIASAGLNQRQPEICRNFEDDLYVVWQDGRHGEGIEKLFMQCITTSGSKLWDVGGVHVCNYPGRQSKPSILGDAAGNFWVAWLDEREKSRSGVQLIAQKYNIGGDSQWLPDGLSIGESMEEWNDYSLAINKNGYLYLAWNQTVSSKNKNVFYQKIHPDGTKKFEYSGLRMGGEFDHQMSPVVAVNLDGKGLIAWIQIDQVQNRTGIKAAFLRD
ncbi:MAG: hypothetical protein IPP17_04840 [Bacteroidetes bacterium]|nr:hypothetical protein [Bacteroidota bacterium]